jgi:hypothetical protein
MKIERLSGEEHFKECLGIAKLRPRVGGTKPIPEESLVELYTKYFTENDNYHAFGCIEDGKIVSWIGIVLMENKARGRFWVITALYTTLFRDYFSFNHEEIGLLIKEAFNLAETKKYYEYYYFVSERIATVYESQYRKNKYVQTGRYDLVELDRVPANTQSTVDLYWKLMGQETKPDTIIVKKRVLRDMFR